MAYIETTSNTGNSTNATTTLAPGVTTTTTTLVPGVTTLESTNQTSSTVYEERDSSLVPEIKEDFLGAMDTVFVWMRFIHSALVPIVIFILHKDLRKKMEMLLCCWRPNSVDKMIGPSGGGGIFSNGRQSGPRPISAYIQDKRIQWEKKQKKFKNVTNYRYMFKK